MMKKSSKGTKCSKCGTIGKVQQTLLGEPLCAKCMKEHKKDIPAFTDDKDPR